MARTVNEIFEAIVAEANSLAVTENNEDVQEMLANSSQFALWKIIFYAVAFCVWTLEYSFDAFVTLVTDLMNALLPHGLRWYRKKALTFQYGIPLYAESDKYNNTGYTTAQIEASKIIKYAAVNESTVDGRRVLLIKIAGETAGDLAVITAPQEAAFTAYIEEIKDAGNKIIIYNREADLLKATVDVFINPQLIDTNGNRTDGGGKPIEDAAKAYLKQLSFNGEISIAKFADALQEAYGVSEKNVFVKAFERKIGVDLWQSISTTYIPTAGYARFDVAGLTINYIPHVLV